MHGTGTKSMVHYIIIDNSFYSATRAGEDCELIQPTSNSWAENLLHPAHNL
jgi:hypothetical protein